MGRVCFFSTRCSKATLGDARTPCSVADSRARAGGAWEWHSEELRREAEEISRSILQQESVFSLIVEEIERIRGSIDRFAAIETMDDLVKVYQAQPFCHSTNFNRLLGAFWLDALQNGDTVMTANIHTSHRPRAERVARDLSGARPSDG